MAPDSSMDSNEQTPILRAVFLTTFLDLVGFSIIFPLFPQLLDHYLTLEGPDSFIGQLIHFLQKFSVESENAEFLTVVLFGGLLGSLYSVLQFLCAPIWGVISDRYGRRKTLLITISGTFISYLAWFFAKSFAILILARLIGGIMAGNISTASAVIADTTGRRERSKGMAIIGIAFGLGFVIGPAFGGAASFVDFTKLWPGSAAWGINPFSFAALIALSLAALNLVYVWFKLPETHPPEKRGKGISHRTANPITLFRSTNAPGIQRTNVLSFCFLTAFSAMEFTLVFLTVERFQFTPRSNAGMFVFIGFVIALVQGGAVRKMAPKFGDKPLVIGGLIAIFPGFILIGAAQSMLTLFTGLALMAAGSAFANPCLSGLISQYAPQEHQGLSLGLFRSIGALSRAIGPVIGGLLYWKYGAQSPYTLGAILIWIPIILAFGLPKPAYTTPEA
jgi:MFS family permease